jgi:RNA polymerase sigma factor (sigma-70 family)
MTINDFNRAVDLWADGLYRFVLKSICDSEKSKDIIQDCYEKLWFHHGNIDKEKVKAYLFTTAHHTMIDYIRKARHETLPDWNKISEPLTDHGYTDLQEVLHEAVQKLPAIQRSVILLRDYEGYSYREISGITGITEVQVKVYIYRARIFLKSYIGQIHNVV